MSKIMLEELYIHNFKSFYKSKFEFGKLNCLIAPNNAGKSNLIEALKFLNDLIYENTSRALFKAGDHIKNYHYPDDENMTLNAKFKIKNSVLVVDEIIKYDISVIFLFNFDFNSKKSNIDVLVSGKIKSITIDKADIKDSLGLRVFDEDIKYFINNYEHYIKKIDKKNYRNFTFNYNHNTLNYEITNTQYATTDEILIKLLGLNILEKNRQLSKPLSFILLFNKYALFASHYFHAHDIKRIQQLGYDYLLENGTNLTEYLGDLDESIFSDISTSLIGEVELINSIEIKKGFANTIVFKEEINSTIHDVKLQNVSDGTIHFIAIMSAILGNGKAIGMMIEEPERHMHMKVLLTIIDTMRDDDKQIFFTTHSGEILRELNQDEIIFLYRDEETGDTKSLNASKIKQLEKIFKRYKYEISDIVKDGILGYIGDYNG